MSGILETFGLIFGGIGLFLLGMNFMTEGLKSMAGETLKDRLKKFTGGIFSSIFSGAVLTALIQSSSATTFMTIGFVSAGLLSFSQSLGVIIGANVGSTSTGWIVSAIGFQINMSMLALPLIGAGVVLKLLSKNRFSSQGQAITGFGLLFLGIDILQNGMGGFTEVIDLSQFQGQEWWWLPVLVIVGAVMTILLQSSSAAVVTTLTALHTGAIDFNQAALLVIGQNVGTTAKAFLAAIGGTVAAKRTATAHILFNLFTGLIAVIALPLLIYAVMRTAETFQVEDPAVQLAIFHTLFNISGVLLILPILKWFKKAVKWIIPEKKETPYMTFLDESVAAVGPVALEAVRRALRKMLYDLAAAGKEILDDRTVKDSHRVKFQQVTFGLSEIQQFLSTIRANETSVSALEYKQQVAMVHAVDHIGRLLKALKEAEHYIQGIPDSKINKFMRDVDELFNSVIAHSEAPSDKTVEMAEERSMKIANRRRYSRQELLEATVKENLTVDEGINAVQFIQFLDRLAYHTWRALYHTSGSRNS
ncbi:Na/Pi cotransporter family protein [Salipaludibacillus sp. CUR1]|uniref:Na/Pi cotransporter family protein n=1 Tax=Salipaludibacillus sp. CUR1 TaxID=2820003 RepID=UPI001E46DCFB|nr:Na/Pi cotransporter family protein [Salipaludibacillus sp. CUR1]MCE7793297.1 Na/Pi cotransporter family protein [Salipaludibacillus sp. CUR1]